MSPRGYWIFYLLGSLLLRSTSGKWVEGHINTKENWAFLSRFCFLSMDGQFEYLIEYDKDLGTPNLLLYHDHESQWPTVYKSRKTCKEKEAILDVGRRQMVTLSHWYPEMEASGCVLRRQDKELPASKSSTTTTKATPITSTSTTKPQNANKPQAPQFTSTTLPTKTTNPPLNSTITPTISTNTEKNTTVSTISNTVSTITDDSTVWFEVMPTDEMISTTEGLKDEWETVGNINGSHFENLNNVDVEVMFSGNYSGRKKRSTIELYERLRRRNLNAESSKTQYNVDRNTERLIVSCHKTIRFTSARPKWWFIAISNCDSNKGLDVKYKFLMTNGDDGDFWHEHFSADEFYILPILITFTFAYVILNVAVVMCSVELKSRHLLHCTYKLFLMSVVVQHCGVTLQTMGVLKYGMYGFGGDWAKVFGQFLSGMSETTYLLMLVLLAKGYTVTRGRLKVSFTVKVTVFMCCYCVTYIVLFIYQAKCFDPGEVLYLYDSVVGYCLVALRILAWCAFAYATFFTVSKFPEKNMFYAPFFICGSLWFYAGPIFILTANYHIDKWVRESVVTAVLLFITFCGHIMFLLLTLPVFANKNFPYHVRTTQIGIMEITNNAAIDNFGHNPYQPTTPGAAQTVIIPLTRRTEELIGSMYTQYMATAPPISLANEPPKLNGTNNINHPKPVLTNQDSLETNNSDDIKPIIKKNESIKENLNKGDEKNENQNGGVFTVEKKMAELNNGGAIANNLVEEEKFKIDSEKVPSPRSTVLPPIKPRRSMLVPLQPAQVPSWSLAKGPSVVAMVKKEESDSAPAILSVPPAVKKVPAVNKSVPSSGEISTIHEGHIETFTNTVSNATLHLFSANSKKI